MKASTKLVIQVFHKSQTKKKHRKRNLVGSASVSLNEFLNKHPLPHPRPVDYDVRLSCPPPQRKSPTIAGKQQHSATLTMRFAVPHREPRRSYDSPPATPMSEHYETELLLSDAPSCAYIVMSPSMPVLKFNADSISRSLRNVGFEHSRRGRG